jgi:cytochrome c oxidase assembly protein subunit 15
VTDDRTIPATPSLRVSEARAYPRLALLAAVLTLAVIAASAYLRHAQSGLPCGEAWSCAAQADPLARIPAVEVMRGVHRIAAAGASLLLVAMLAISFRERRERRFTAAALALVAGLAVLGIATPGARIPAVGLGNLLGGFALLGVLAAAHASAGKPAASSRGMRTLALATLALVFAQATVGGLIATQSARLACGSFPWCELPPLDELVAGEAWNPWRVPVVVEGKIVTPPGAAWLHVAHRTLSVLVAVLVLFLAARLWRSRPKLAAFLGLALAAVICAGIAGEVFPPTLGAPVAHNFAAALLVALLAYAAALPSLASAPRSSARSTAASPAARRREHPRDSPRGAGRRSPAHESAAAPSAGRRSGPARAQGAGARRPA